MMTVLSFIYKGTQKVSFPSWRNRNASEKLQEWKKKKSKKIQQNYWSIKAEMRKRKKKGYGYIFVKVFIPHKESQPFEGDKKKKNHELSLTAVWMGNKWRVYKIHGSL